MPADKSALGILLRLEVSRDIHTIPDFPRLLAKGTLGIMADIDALLNKEENKENCNALASMRICLEG